MNIMYTCNISFDTVYSTHEASHTCNTVSVLHATKNFPFSTQISNINTSNQSYQSFFVPHDPHARNFSKNRNVPYHCKTQ
jgi:hypothetical protein